MQLDHEQLRALLALLGESDIQELRLEGDDFRLEVRRNMPGPPAVTMVSSPAAAAPVPVAGTPPLAPAAPPSRPGCPAPSRLGYLAARPTAVARPI